MTKIRKGMTLITVLWIVVVLIGLVSVVTLMTQSDLLSSLNLFRRKRTIKIAESTSEIVISYLPKFRDLDTLISNDTTISGTTDTTYGYKIIFSNDSSDVGVVSPIPLITGTNPYFYGYSTYLSYTTTGEIIRDSTKKAKRTIEIVASFTLPGGEKMMGHTMYR